MSDDEDDVKRTVRSLKDKRYSRSPQRRAYFYNNLEAGMSLNPLNKNTEETRTGNDSYVISFMLFNLKIQQ